jgi:hypothetical protein
MWTESAKRATQRTTLGEIGANLGDPVTSPLKAFAGFYDHLRPDSPYRLILGSIDLVRVTAIGESALGSDEWLPQLGDIEDLLPASARDAGFRWKALRATPADEQGSLVSRRHQLELNGIPLRGYSLITQTQTDATTPETTEPHASSPAMLPEWIYGNIPSPLARAESAGDFGFRSIGHFHYLPSEVRTKVATQQGFSTEFFSEGRPVYFAEQDKLHAAYEFVISASSDPQAQAPAVPLLAIISADTAQLLEQTALAFHLDGKAKLYRENAIASKGEGIVELPLPNLNPNTGQLNNALFMVKTCKLQLPGPACAFGASAKTGDYRSVKPDDEAYDELVAYHGITRSMSWYRTLMGESVAPFATENTWGAGRKNFGLELESIGRLTVYVRAMTKTPNASTTLDNALYLPGGVGGSGSPEIAIGTGWEESFNTPPRALRRIGKDADVSMHEFGHHIVYRTITELKGQSLAMHEGIADYFTYAATGNNLLAESVVATGGYLRAGNRSGTLADFPPTSATPPHIAGEFWSTVLWDVRKNLGSWEKGYYKFDKIMYHALDLMRANETYYGAIAAMLRAAELFASVSGDDPVTLKEGILSPFYKRGFIKAPSGDGSLPPASALLAASTQQASVAPTADTAAGSSRSKKKSSFLGMSCTVGAHASNSSRGHVDMGTLLILALLGVAASASGVRRSQSAKAPVKQRNPKNS